MYLLRKLGEIFAIFENIVPVTLRLFCQIHILPADIVGHQVNFGLN